MKKYINKKIIIIITIFILITIIIYYGLFNNTDEEIILTTTTLTTTTNKKNYFDIKGSVKNPGVYEFKENDRVIDAINMAGGLKKNANTSNINLSKKLTSEMVIYVYNNSEIQKEENKLSCEAMCKVEIVEVNNCTTTNNDLININTASLEELLTLPSIGESKAKNIIEYRETNGLFNTIEDIKNVSGIGDLLYEKIKDKITI